ncbi:hypothetical protein Ccrd_025030 [Cynara cardunculus var. scolymus]|uniref:Uncharacterized protein n=1 Tax=Cynara cardunculus var. scolymus TaxID=59895 RepID=A0A103XBI7_CYNCS|nr:hypothetical protein Ccrd_025030 [Cynara cardunculus var. scolymus]
MEAATVAVAPRGISMPMPSSRKERRVVSDHPLQNPGNEVQQGRESLDLDFFSVTVAGGSDHELRLDDERFDSQIKEHIAANLKLQEQLHERENSIQDLHRTLEDKDKELHANRLDHEAAWAKEDLLGEQNKELATFRRECDNSEAEEKDQQLIEMQEQHRVAQETIIYKDEQIREAQAWITRAQEMDVLQSTTNHSLQAELREHMELYNLVFAEMQQLQHEFSEARGRSDTYSDDERATQKNLKDAFHFWHIKGSEQESSGGSSPADFSKGSSKSECRNHFIICFNWECIYTGQLTAASICYASTGSTPKCECTSCSFSCWPVPFHTYRFFSRKLAKSTGTESHSVVPSPNAGGPITKSHQFLQVHESIDNTYTGEPQSQQILQHISSQFRGSINLNHSDHDNEHRRSSIVGKIAETVLDEESLLACVVRTIPPTPLEE